MPKNLNTSEAYIVSMVETNTSKDITVLEKTVQRLAGELEISLKETEYSGISYKKEIEGNNSAHSVRYFKDMHGHYERIAIENQNNQFGISNCEGDYLVILKVLGKNLYPGAKRPRTTSIERKIDSAILIQSQIRKEPENRHEVCVQINKQDLESISCKTIEKYI